MVDLKDAYIHIHIAPHHRLFLRFTFEGVADQYAVLPLGVSLAPHTFTKCIDATLSPLRQMGICILNYLDNWLVLARSEWDLVAHRALLLSHLERLGMQINLQKGHLSPRQRMVFLGKIIDSAQLQSSKVYWLTIQWLAASLKPGTSHSLMFFQRLLSLMVASLAAPPILAQSLSPVPCLASGPVLQSKQPLWPPGQLLACFSQAYSWDWAPEGRWSHSCGAFMSGASTGAWAAPNESEQHQFRG